MSKLILDLCAGSGAWSEPYVKAGYEVVRVDLPEDVRLLREGIPRAHGILAAPPCTVFSYARNRYMPSDDELRCALSVVDACLRQVLIHKPAWWALENPGGRIASLVPRLKAYGPWYFDPHQCGGWLNPPGDHYHKKTGIWGTFNKPQIKDVEPVVFTNSKGQKGSWMWACLGGKSDRTKELRSATPMGFAKAFKAANP